MSCSRTSIASCSYSQCLLCAQILKKEKVYLELPSTSNTNKGWILEANKYIKIKITRHVFQVIQILVVVSTDCFPQLRHSQRSWCNPWSPLLVKISMLASTEQVEGWEAMAV